LGKSFDKVLMGAAGTDGSYEIKQSAILDTNASLVRTPSSTGNRKKWTISVWVKKGKLGQIQYIYGGQSSNETDLRFSGTDTIEYFGYQSSSHTWGFSTARKFRDVGAWYHIVAIFDSANGTQALRARLFVNGEELPENGATSTVAAVTQNQDSMMNLVNVPQYIGKLHGNDYYFKGNMAEFHFLDGAAKAPTDFAETNSETGQWVPIEYTGGSYGTNGFYLKFKSGAIGTDSSGQGNNHTVANIANADIVTDTPNNNFCTLNSAMTYSATTLSEGNLKSAQSNHSDTMATFKIPETGKWYFECVATTAGGAQVGISKTSYQPSAGDWVATTISLIFSNGNAGTGSGSAYIGSAIGNGNTVGVAIDSDNGKIYFAKNNTWGNSGNLANGTNPAATFTATDGWQPIVYGPNGTVQTFNFGQKDFAYTPPSGFLTLSTANLPDPSIPLPSAHFNTVLYTGNGGTQTITGVGFEPTLVWSKSRGDGEYHIFTDQVRGNTHPVFSNSAEAQETRSNGITGFNSDGYALGNWTGNNKNGVAQVSWNWKGNGAGSQNTDGTINSTATSANQASGFSIVTYTGNNQAATIGHGLGVAPDLVIVRANAVSGSWHVYNGATSSDSENYYLLLDTNGAIANSGTGTVPWNNTRATSSVFSVGAADASTNINNVTYVAYCFASKPGFSSTGIYTGNGNANGPFVNLGFKPAWVMVKRTDATAYWAIFDNTRSPFNEMNKEVYANEPQAETTSYKVDFLSTGFKFRNTGNDVSTNDGVYLYLAFAESPFKYANAR